MAAGNVIKNAVGIAGILVLIVTVSAPLLQLISITCMLKILAAVIEPLADKQFISIIDTSGNILGLLCLIVIVQCSLFYYGNSYCDMSVKAIMTSYALMFDNIRIRECEK